MKDFKLYEYAPDGRTVDKKFELGKFEHLTVQDEDLSIAYIINGVTTRYIYEYEGALYAQSREIHSLVGPPTIGCFAFARQKLPTGRVALLYKDSWLIRVTEPYWRVFANEDRGDRPSIDIEPRFSVITSHIGADCYHLNNWDAALADATQQAARLKTPLPDSFQYATSVIPADSNYPAGIDLGRLYPRTPEAAKHHKVSRTHRIGLGVTEQQIAQIAQQGPEALIRTADASWGVRPGGTLIWLNRISKLGVKHQRKVLAETSAGQYLLHVENNTVVVQSAEDSWTGIRSEPILAGKELAVDTGESTVDLGEITSLTEVFHADCHHPESTVYTQCCTSKK